MRLLSLLPLLLCLAVASVALAGRRQSVDLSRLGRSVLCLARFPQADHAAMGGRAGRRGRVILAIDDMRGHEKWEAYLRPILERLKQIDGRAPVSIMTNQIEPDEPHLQHWLNEGVSLETHTVDHPCPLLAGGDLAKAKSTYDRCVDQLARDSAQPAGGVSHALLRFVEHGQPSVLCRDLQPDHAGGNFLAIDSLGLSILHAERSGAAARAGLRRRRARSLSEIRAGGPGVS